MEDANHLYVTLQSLMLIATTILCILPSYYFPLLILLLLQSPLTNFHLHHHLPSLGDLFFLTEIIAMSGFTFLASLLHAYSHFITWELDASHLYQLFLQDVILLNYFHKY